MSQNKSHCYINFLLKIQVPPSHPEAVHELLMGGTSSTQRETTMAVKCINKSSL
jgi:hypothetical protein